MIKINRFFLLILTLGYSALSQADELSDIEQRLLMQHQVRVAVAPEVFSQAQHTLQTLIEGVNAAVRNTSDVHVLDGFVLQHLEALLALGRTLQFGESVTPDEAMTRLAARTTFDPMCMAGAHHCLRDNLPGFDTSQQELFARALTFAVQLQDNSAGYQGGIWELEAMKDNWETNGGCLAGRLNRVFVAYLRMADFMIL